MKKFDYRTINHLLQEITSWSDEGKKFTITEKFTEDFNNEWEEDISDLIDFTVKYTTDGDHKNDGQMVGYDFTFTHPNGAETNIGTEMCLMVGFNTWGEVTFNQKASKAKPNKAKEGKKNQTFTRKQVEEILADFAFHLSDNGDPDTDTKEWLNDMYPTK